LSNPDLDYMDYSQDYFGAIVQLLDFFPHYVSSKYQYFRQVDRM